MLHLLISARGGAKTILFGGCKTTFCRQKGVASARLGRGQSEPYSFLSDVQRLTPSSKIIYFIFKIGEIVPKKNRKSTSIRHQTTDYKLNTSVSLSSICVFACYCPYF